MDGFMSLILWCGHDHGKMSAVSLLRRLAIPRQTKNLSEMEALPYRNFCKFARSITITTSFAFSRLLRKCGNTSLRLTYYVGGGGGKYESPLDAKRVSGPFEEDVDVRV